MVEVGRVAEVDAVGVVVELRPELGDEGGGAGKAVDAFDFETEVVDGQNALDDEHRDCGLVTVEKIVEADAEDWAEGREIGPRGH